MNFPSLVRPDTTSSADDCDVAALDVHMRLAEHRFGHRFSTETAWSIEVSTKPWLQKLFSWECILNKNKTGSSYLLKCLRKRQKKRQSRWTR